ncbi:MAG: replication initiation factor domain-containing protein [Pedobacter sp.]
MTCFIHWMAFTIPSETPIENIFNKILELPFSDFQLQQNGQDGYKIRYVNDTNTILVLTDGGHEQMGHHVRLTGQACEALQKHLLPIAKRVMNICGTFSRIDLAVDDFAGMLDMNEMEEAIRQGQCTSRFKNPPRVENGFDQQTGKLVGKAIKFGSRTSRMYLRIYDKAAEQKVDFLWVRLEIEAKRKNATAIMKALAEGETTGGMLFGLLDSYLSFKELCTDSNRSRRPVAAWWKQFLGETKKITLLSPTKKTKPNDFRWFINNYDKTLVRVMEECGPEIILDMYASGLKKLDRSKLADQQEKR